MSRFDDNIFDQDSLCDLLGSIMIAESIALISAANSAFEVIKAALQNGKELADVGSKAAEYFELKAGIQETAVKKAGGRPLDGRTDLEEFMALEKLRQQEEHLREQMVYAGRPGMWEDWQKFQAMAARRRREAKEAAERAARIRRERQAKIFQIASISIIVVCLWVAVMYGVWFLGKK